MFNQKILKCVLVFCACAFLVTHVQAATKVIRKKVIVKNRRPRNKVIFQIKPRRPRVVHREVFLTPAPAPITEVHHHHTVEKKVIIKPKKEVVEREEIVENDEESICDEDNEYNVESYAYEGNASRNASEEDDDDLDYLDQDIEYCRKKAEGNVTEDDDEDDDDSWHVRGSNDDDQEDEDEIDE